MGLAAVFWQARVDARVGRIVVGIGDVGLACRVLA
jgi:hypothetical protein